MIRMGPEKSKKAPVQKTRAASPSGKEAAVERAVLRKTVQSSERAAISSAPLNEEAKARPKKHGAAAASGEGPFLPTTYSLPQSLIDRVSEWAHENRVTKSAGARALLEKGLLK
jgi:hypothetical protein